MWVVLKLRQSVGVIDVDDEVHEVPVLDGIGYLPVYDYIDDAIAATESGKYQMVEIEVLNEI